MRVRSTAAPGSRLVLLAILFVMALMADKRTASAAPPGGAEDVAAPPIAGDTPFDIAGDTPFDRQGMWVWYVDRSEGGSVGRIVARPSRQPLGAEIAEPVFGYRPVDAQPVLKRGSSGDLVVWAQEHLRAAGQSQILITGIFGKQTGAAVRDFQASQGLPVDGTIGTTTWRSLLAFGPARPRWAGRRAKRGGGGATASRAFPPRRPLSASLPAKAYEIDPGPAP